MAISIITNQWFSLLCFCLLSVSASFLMTDQIKSCSSTLPFSVRDTSSSEWRRMPPGLISALFGLFLPKFYICVVDSVIKLFMICVILEKSRSCPRAKFMFLTSQLFWSLLKSQLPLSRFGVSNFAGFQFVNNTGRASTKE